MMKTQSTFATCRSGVCQVVLEQDRDRITAGTAFLVPGGIVTNSHVLRDYGFEVARFRFDDMSNDQGIRLSRETCLNSIKHESPREEHDIAYLALAEPEFQGRHVFSFGDGGALNVGDKVGFLGFPFQMPQLTCHVGYVSSIHKRGVVSVIQIDGSVNGGNSGGPLLGLSDGLVMGVITRAEVGFIAEQFEELMRTLRNNVSQLEGARSIMSVGGIDPIQGLRASQTAMLEIAGTLRRSANVGIGYAFSSNYIRDRIMEIRA